MMRLSPIIKKDLEVRSRSYTLPAVIALVNTVLFIVGLMGSFGLVSRMKQTYEAFYQSFLNIYVFAVLLDLVLVLVIAPLFTASAISGERETGTFDLLLTTRLSAFDIVIEKTASALAGICVVIFSTLPALLLPLMYGGVGLLSVLSLLIAFLPGTFLVLSAGMFASSLGNSVARSIAISYGITFLLTLGIILLSVLFRSFTASDQNYFSYLLVMNPLTPAASLLFDQIGEASLTERLFLFLKLQPDAALLKHPVLICSIFQITAACGFLTLAVMNILPGRFSERISGKAARKQS